MPKVSVVIPAYNHAPYIRQCVDSVLGQTYADLEVIVVDDGSTDRTLEILRRYGDAINLITQANKGTQSARNAALSASSGRLIATLDSDDAWLPHKLERQVEVFERRPEVGLVYALADTIDSEGNRTNVNWHLGAPIDHPHGAFAQLLEGCFIPALTAVFRRRCIDDVGWFDERLEGSGDWDLWLRIAAKYPIACVEAPLALYRVHASNTTKMLFRTKQVCVEHKEVLRRAFQLPEAAALPASVRNKALARVNLQGAETEAIAGDATAIGTELDRAIQTAPTLLDDLEHLGDLLIHWAHLYAANSPLDNPYRRFVRDVFTESTASIPRRPQLRRRVLSESTMGTVFSAHAAGDQDTVRKLLPTALVAKPGWLLNWGVWSIMADALLGPAMASALRGVVRKGSEVTR